MEQLSLQTQSTQLQELETLKNTFIRSVQHELRTPVSIILGYADLLKNGALGDLEESQQQAILTIAGQADILRALVERITTLLDLEAYEAVNQPMTINDIVTSVVETQRHQAVQLGIMLESHFSSDLPLICGNPGYLRQTIECLIENALKFTSTGGFVKIEAMPEDDWVSIRVTDTGIGIAADKVGSIFDTFYQIDGSITRQYDGLGLGLAVAKAVVEAHGGSIRVESQPGQGSCFTLKLPALPLENVVDERTLAQIKRRRILIVDDEELVALTLRDGLEKLPDCEIVTATSGQQALKISQEQAFDVLITDYGMPDIDGMSLAQRIQRQHPQTGTIMITAYGESIMRRYGTQLPVQRILDKPVRLAEIRQAALDLLALSGSSSGQTGGQPLPMAH